MKIEVDYPASAELKQNVTRADAFEEDPHARKVADAERLVAMMATVRKVPVTDAAAEAAVRIVELSHPRTKGAPGAVTKSVRYGASPRGGQALLLVARVAALVDGR